MQAVITCFRVQIIFIKTHSSVEVIIPREWRARTRQSIKQQYVLCCSREKEMVWKVRCPRQSVFELLYNNEVHLD